jgi:hypothetical protein
MILQHEGFQFPPKDNVGAALVETEAVITLRSFSHLGDVRKEILFSMTTC